MGAVSDNAAGNEGVYRRHGGVMGTVSDNAAGNEGVYGWRGGVTGSVENVVLSVRMDTVSEVGGMVRCTEDAEEFRGVWGGGVTEKVWVCGSVAVYM